MFNDDDRPKPKPALFTPPNLENLSVAELDDYVGLLEAEIERAKADKTKKQASRAAADAIFKS